MSNNMYDKMVYVIRKSRQCLLSVFAPLTLAINVLFDDILFLKRTLNIIY